MKQILIIFVLLLLYGSPTKAQEEDSRWYYLLGQAYALTYVKSLSVEVAVKLNSEDSDLKQVLQAQTENFLRTHRFRIYDSWEECAEDRADSSRGAHAKLVLSVTGLEIKAIGVTTFMLNLEVYDDHKVKRFLWGPVGELKVPGVKGSFYSTAYLAKCGSDDFRSYVKEILDERLEVFVAEHAKQNTDKRLREFLSYNVLDAARTSISTEPDTTDN